MGCNLPSLLNQKMQLLNSMQQRVKTNKQTKKVKEEEQGRTYLASPNLDL